MTFLKFNNSHIKLILGLVVSIFIFSSLKYDENIPASNRKLLFGLNKWISEADEAKSSLSSITKVAAPVFASQINMMGSQIVFNDTLIKLSKNVTNVNEKLELMHIALTDPEYSKSIVVNPESTKKCVAKKRIVLDVNRCAVGGRIKAIFSTILLAVLTNRVLEITWAPNKLCPAKYTDLFMPKSQDSLVLKPFVYDDTPQKYNSIRNEFSCHIRLDQNAMENFYFFKDKVLFDRMNDICDVIFLVTNQVYTKLFFEHSRFGSQADRLVKTYQHPYQQITSIAFKPSQTILDKAHKFIESNFAGKRWISFHSVENFDKSGRGMLRGINCLNHLLKEKLIDAIFFSSDHSKFVDSAKGLLRDNSKLFTYPKIYNQDSNIQDIEAAIVEWYIIGEATYCGSNTITRSSFSVSSILRGNCKYVPFDKGEYCSLDAFSSKKEELLNMYHTNEEVDTLPVIDDAKRSELWQSIYKSPQLVLEQCFSVNNIPSDSVLSYWV